MKRGVRNAESGDDGAETGLAGVLYATMLRVICKPEKYVNLGVRASKKPHGLLHTKRR
jgi:hypothetical protein